jgi:ADP-ribosylglycohydrolase
MLHRNDNILLRIAQADAYAMSCEYIKFPRDEEHQREALKHPKYSLGAGMYTDDTQMSIAVTEVLLEGPPYTKEKFAEAFVRCFKRDPRDGYARGFQGLLEGVKDSADFLKRIKTDSIKNGACMRAVPLGVIKDIPELLDVAAIQASVTHDTDAGIYSAQMVALMSHFALYEKDEFIWLDSFLRKNMPRTGPKRLGYMLDWVPTYSCENGTPPWSGRVDEHSHLGVAHATVQAAYRAIVDNKNIIDVLKAVIQFGGDTDTTAAVAVGIASTRFTEELPEFFERDLEVGQKYGVDFLKSLGRDLMSGP